MKIISSNNTPKKEIIKEAVKALEAGGLIIYPTDTCYGLGADALGSKAVDKLIKFKGSRKKKPISIAVANQNMAADYVKINLTAKNIFQNLLPGPVTVVCQGKHQVDPRLESSLKTLGIRIPDYPLTLDIIEAFGKPITTTSANISSGKTPYSINDILSPLSAKKRQLISLIIDAGKLPRRPPSSVVDTTINQPAILRQGEINFDRIGAKTVVTGSPKETQKFAQQLLKKHLPTLKKKSLIFTLQGELGAGKTQFAKGLGRELKITQPITSPTFVVLKEHPYKLEKIKGTFYHVDAWRAVSSPTALKFMQKYIQPGSIIAIEWAQKIKKGSEKIFPPSKSKVINLEIKHLGKNRRRIRFVD